MMKSPLQSFNIVTQLCQNRLIKLNTVPVYTKAQGQMCNSEIFGFQFKSISCPVIVQTKMNVAI